MTCKDCIHYVPCFSGGKSIWDGIEQTADDCCKNFIPKSRYIELPCAVGDTVYINGCFGGIAEPHRIKYMSYRNVKGDITIFYEADLLDENRNPTGSDCGFWNDSIGKTVFLTKEEAEKALERSEGK